MRCLNFRFSLNNPFFHGIAIGLVLALCFPQASLARDDPDGSQTISSPAMYSLMGALNHDLMCAHQITKKACGSDALSFTLANAPKPEIGDFQAISNEGHLIDISISRFEPLVGEIQIPEGITQAEIDAVYQDEITTIEVDFAVAAFNELNSLAQEHGLDPNEIELPEFPKLPDTFEEARLSVGIAIVTIAGDGDVVYAEAMTIQTTLDDQQVTYLMPIEEVTFEQKVDREAMPANAFSMMIDNNGETDGDVLASFWQRVRCSIAIGAWVTAVYVGFAAFAACLASPNLLICVAAAAGICAAGTAQTLILTQCLSIASTTTAVTLTLTALATFCALVNAILTDIGLSQYTPTENHYDLPPHINNTCIPSHLIHTQVA